MSPLAILASVAAALGVIATAFFGYRSVRRQTSGDIRETAAAQLWAEARDIREDAVQRAKDMVVELDALRASYRDLQQRSYEQARRILDLEEEADASHRIITAIKAEYERLARKLGEEPVTFPDPHEATRRKHADE